MIFCRMRCKRHNYSVIITLLATLVKFLLKYNQDIFLFFSQIINNEGHISMIFYH